MKIQILTFIFTVITFQFLYGQTTTDAMRIRYPETGFGARTMAMGGNGVALEGEYSSIYWNPAGLAGIRHSEISGEFSHLNFANEAQFSGNLSDMSENFSRLRSLGLAVPLPTSRGSLVLGFGYNFVRDFDEYLYFSGINPLSNGLEFKLEDDNGNYQLYPFDQNVEQTEEVTTEGGLHQWSLGAGMALSPNFDVGATLNFWRGRDEYRLFFQQFDDANIYNVYPGDFDRYSVTQNLITDYKAFGLKLGGMFKLNRNLRLGMAVEFPTTFTLNESYRMSDELVFDDGYVDALDYEPGEWEYKVKTPYRFDAGLALRSGSLSLTGGLTYQDWTQLRFEAPDNYSLEGDYSDLLNENRYFRQDLRETINYHAGGEIALAGGNTFLRGGYAVYPSPLREAASDMDRKFYSGGVGVKAGKNVRLDLTYVRGSWQRESEDSYTPGGTFEDITEGRLFLGIRYQF